MALPTKEKTWQYHVNVSRASLVACMVGFKDSMKAFASNPWTVWGSSQGTNFGNNDGNDRWGTPVINNWIVLKQPAISSTFSWCLQYTSSINGEFGMTVSAGGFNTNGTATTRPTASDEYTYTSAIGNQELRRFGAFPGISNIIQSTDGLCLRWWRCAASKTQNLHFLEMVKNPVTGWSGLVMGNYSTGTGTEIATYGNYNDSNIGLYGIFNGAFNGLYLTSEGWGGSTLGEQITFPDDDTAEYPLSNIYVANVGLGGRGAKKGSMYDLWWGSTAVAVGDTYPGDGSATFAQFGHLVFPWNGTTPVIA